MLDLITDCLPKAPHMVVHLRQSTSPRDASPPTSKRADSLAVRSSGPPGGWAGEFVALRLRVRKESPRHGTDWVKADPKLRQLEARRGAN